MRYLTLGEATRLSTATNAGHAAMETFLVLNGMEIDAAVDEQERLMLDRAAGRVDRRHLTDWLRQHLRPLA